MNYDNGQIWVDYLLSDAVVYSHDSHVNNWDMLDWYHRSFRIDHSCGFAACALGHACMIPQFQAQGLKLWGNTPMLTPANGGEELGPEQATMQLLGITREEAASILYTSNYDDYHVSPKMVAERIREIMEKYKTKENDHAS